MKSQINKTTQFWNTKARIMCIRSGCDIATKENIERKFAAVVWTGHHTYTNSHNMHLPVIKSNSTLLGVWAQQHLPYKTAKALSVQKFLELHSLWLPIPKFLQCWPPREWSFKHSKAKYQWDHNREWQRLGVLMPMQQCSLRCDFAKVLWHAIVYVCEPMCLLRDMTLRAMYK